MFVRAWIKNGTTYAALVENKRVDGKVVQKRLINFGVIDPSVLPYLKAAYTPANKRPALVYLNGEVYDPRA